MKNKRAKAKTISRKVFFERLKILMDQAPAAMLHLKRVTGKLGYRDISPMDEIRWSDKCWDCFNTLIQIETMLQRGITIEEADEDILKAIKLDDAWVGKVTLSKFKA